MANFFMHGVGAGLAGLGSGCAALLIRGGENPWFAGATALIAFVGAMLPDIDHDEAIPNREIFSILAAAVPAGLLGWLAREWRWTSEQNICFFALSYLGIRFVLAPLFKKVTAHRGIIHSIPFGLLAAEVLALSLFRFTVMERLIAGAALFIGFMTHLALDELYAVDFLNRRLKQSFGTAIKLRSSEVWATGLCYLGLIVCTGVFLYRFGPQVMRIIERRTG
jgi:membrane-bound metal-dependent hydrolase YbcI (DUF457 family)